MPTENEGKPEGSEPGAGTMIDVAIVGAGPCGIAAGAAARQAGRDAVLFDRGTVTQSLLGYPYYMTFFSTAEKLAIAGVPFSIPESNPTRRQALAYYRHVVRYFELDIRQRHDIRSIRHAPDGVGFVLEARSAAGRDSIHRARHVVVATGGFHQPNQLGCPGEELDKVRHWYTEPYPYWDADVLVVGGSNSAVEASLELWRNGTRVTLVHFKDDIDPGVKSWVVPDIRNRLENGEIAAHFGTRVARIEPGRVVLRREADGHETALENDFVLALTGWRSDPVLLRQLGVKIDADTGIPSHDPETMETNVGSVFIAGVLAAGNNANRIFIENGKHHGGLIMEALRRHG